MAIAAGPLEQSAGINNPTEVVTLADLPAHAAVVSFGISWQQATTAADDDGSLEPALETQGIGGYLTLRVRPDAAGGATFATTLTPANPTYLTHQCIPVTGQTTTGTVIDSVAADILSGTDTLSLTLGAGDVPALLIVGTANFSGASPYGDPDPTGTWTVLADDVGGGGFHGKQVAVKRVTSAGTYTASWNNTGFGHGFSAAMVALKEASGSIPFDDDFESAGPLSGSGWTAFNGAAVPGAAKLAGQYNSGSITAPDGTTWFNENRGRADWKLVDFPSAGEPDIEIRVINCGVGPSSSPADNLSAPATWAFCGPIVHLENTGAPNYEFLLPCVRGLNNPTIESKTTINGVSTPDQTATDPVGQGVTHADIRILLRSDKTLRWAYRPPNSNAAWTTIAMPGQSAGVSAGGGLTYASGKAWIGLLTYSFSDVPIPFTGTADRIYVVADTPTPGGVVSRRNVQGGRAGTRLAVQ